MRVRAMLLFVIALTMTACGNSRDDHAAQACSDEIGTRLAGRNVGLDTGDMRKHVRSESSDTVLVTSSVVLDKGLSSESRQTFECRVRFDSNGAASVLYLQFNWNSSDLKPVR
jgi:hypothetical protein